MLGRHSFVFGHASAFVLKVPQKYRGEKDHFTFVWHSLVIRPVKWSSFKEKYFTEVIFLRRLKKKSYFRRQIFVSLHASAFVFRKRRKGTAVKKDNFTFVWHSLVIRPVKQSSSKEEFFTQVIFLLRLQQKNLIFEDKFLCFGTRRLFVSKPPQKYSGEKR